MIGRNALFLLVVAWVALSLPAPTRAAGSLSISGITWIDTNMNGRRDPGEPLGGASLFLVCPTGSCGFTISKRDGTYNFDELEPGKYDIFLDPAGYTSVLTYPSLVLQGQPHVSITLGNSVEHMDFGFVPVELDTVLGKMNEGGIPTVTGVVTIDGKRATDVDVKGYIGDRQCAFPRPYTFPADTGPGSYSLLFARDALITGCGRDGDTITFTVNGRRANETIRYPPASDILNLTAGSQAGADGAALLPPNTGQAGLKR